MHIKSMILGITTVFAMMIILTSLSSVASADIYDDSQKVFDVYMDARCEAGLIPVMRYDQKTVCTTIESAELLIKRGYAKEIIAPEHINESHIEIVEYAKGTFRITINAPDKNIDQNVVDIFEINVWSDTNIIGIPIMVTETETNSGVFEAFVITSYDKSAIHQYDDIQIDMTDSDSTTSGDGISSAPGYSASLEESLVLQSGRVPAATHSPSNYASDSDLGFAVGGAQDINNFRNNIENNYLPLYEDITYEGLFHDYYFDTGKSQKCEKLFCPSYSYAVSKDPFSKQTEHYLTVGLNSGIKESDFQRKNLNLVVVLDVSGSMDTPFDVYHYDGYDQNPDQHGEDDYKTKMRLANESLVGLVDHLNEDDNFGLVLFSDNSHIVRDLKSMDGVNTRILKDDIMHITAVGSTNMEAGITTAISLFDTHDSLEYENRIIFITDAMPNASDISKEGLLSRLNDAADQRGIYSTFVGVGVDFNTELIENITKMRGSNYYSVHSASEFKNQMDQEFEFMVTPLVFDLTLTVDADGYDIVKVYGTPDFKESTGEILKINTLFPSKTKDGQTKGGIVLLKLVKKSNDAVLSLQTVYENKNGIKDTDVVFVAIDDHRVDDYYENSGIRKGILLARYADVMKTWVFYERIIELVNTLGEDKTGHMLGYHELIIPEYHHDGIYIPEYVNVELGQWERQSIALRVSEGFTDYISELKIHFESEMTVIKDKDLAQELKILEKLQTVF